MKNSQSRRSGGRCEGGNITPVQSEAYELLGMYGDHAPIFAAMHLLETKTQGDAEAEKRWTGIVDFMGEVLVSERGAHGR